MISVPTHVAVDEVLPPEATSAGQARRLLRDALSGIESEDSVDAAQMAVSEIVTNALVHAGTPMHFRVLLGASGVRVELGDGSPHLPHRRDYSAVASTGRGLHVVGEVVDRWGAFPSGGGKIVWFEISEGQDEYAEDAEPVLGDPDAPIAVELLNVPLLMHAAWQEHAAALLRELLLVRLDEDDAAIEHHAAASEALNVLFEQIPAPDLGEHPEAIMAAATEPGVSRSRIMLRVQPSSMAHFEVLDSALVEAVEMADRGQLLSPPTQPEVQHLRHWLCDQVRSQAAGGIGTAVGLTDRRTRPGQQPGRVRVGPLRRCRVDPGGDRRRRHEPDRGRERLAARAAGVRRRPRPGRRAADHAHPDAVPPGPHRRIHAAPGQRPLPLLGNRVTVPVNRADGSEVEIDLQIESMALPNGRRVFTAEFFA